MTDLTQIAFVLIGSIQVASFIFVASSVILCINGDSTWSEEFGLFDSNRKVGGIRFMKIGRLNISFSISKKGA